MKDILAFHRRLIVHWLVHLRSHLLPLERAWWSAAYRFQSWRQKAMPNKEENNRRRRREVKDTWACNVCGEERPDEKISVYSFAEIWPGNVPVMQNIRYCNDRPECAEGAKTIRFVKAPQAP